MAMGCPGPRLRLGDRYAWWHGVVNLDHCVAVTEANICSFVLPKPPPPPARNVLPPKEKLSHAGSPVTSGNAAKPKDSTDTNLLCPLLQCAHNQRHLELE